MKRHLAILTAIIFCLSCTKEIAGPIYPEKISIETDEVIYLGSGSTNYFDITITPDNVDILSGDNVLSIEVVESNISYFQGTAPIFYCMAGISKTEGAKGRYRIGIRDLNKGEKYQDKIRVVLKTITDEGTKTLKSDPICVSYAGNIISELSFLKKDNPTSLLEDFRLEIGSTYITLKSPFITSPKLALYFKTEAETVLVGDVEQISGVTVNDFSKPVTYSFVSATGDVRQYTIQVKHSGLPVVYIHTMGAAAIPPKTEDWLPETQLTIYNTDCSINYSGTIGIRGRGNSTWKYPKKPYALKLDSKAEILGMPKHKRWVLLANWLDRTLLRNHVSFQIAKQTDLAWTPRGQFVEVVLNGEHIGNYYLCEHIKIDKNRVNIDELDENEVDGGYMMEIDTYYDEAFQFKSAKKSFPYMFKDPDEVNESQFAFMQDFINNLEGALYEKTRFNTGEHMQYLDIESFADWWIALELTGNTEIKHPKSTYVHKDKGGKLKAGPVWDFDWKTFRLNNQEWVSKSTLYYDALFEDPTFVATVKERWNKHLPRFREIPAFIQAEADKIRNSEEMNHQMWPVTQNTNEDINLSFAEAVARMKQSYEQKLEFMDREINAMKVEDRTYDLGISQALFGSLSSSEAKSMVSAGARHIEVTMNTFWRDQTEEECYKRARDAKQIIENTTDLEVWSVHLPFSSSLDISVLNDKKRAENVEIQTKMIRLAGEFKPKRLVLHPSSEPISESDRAARIKCARESIGLLLPIAKEIGATLCLENLPRTCLGRDSNEMKALLEGFPEAMVCFDSNHLLTEDHNMFFNNVGNRIATIHASDYDKTDEKHWLMGLGIIDWPNFLAKLRSNGYYGVFMTEVKSATAAEVATAYKNVVCKTN